MGIGFERPALPPRPGAARPAVLVPVSRFPHKRSDLALAYLERLQDATGYDADVHWVGSLPRGLVWKDRPGWHRHDRLDEEAYRRLAAACGVLVYFSEYEGFGMPAVEAVLAGHVPVFSDIPALREVMRGTGCAFHNDSYETFAAAMARAIVTPPDVVRAWGERLIAAHNWPVVVERVVQALAAHGA